MGDRPGGDSSSTRSEQSEIAISRRDFDALIFDLDGVLTDTAIVHRRAWKAVFDQVLSTQHGAQARPFSDADYERYVDGKPRHEGIRSFLASRQIELPETSDDNSDPLGSVAAIGAAKNRAYLASLDDLDLAPFADAQRLLARARKRHLWLAMVSASRNASTLWERIGMDDTFSVIVDGQVAADENLAGKPDPQTFLVAAERLDVAPARAVVFEDASAGIAAGVAGGFGLVVGVCRQGPAHCQALGQAGAHQSVRTLDEVNVAAEPSANDG